MNEPLLPMATKEVPQKGGALKEQSSFNKKAGVIFYHTSFFCHLIVHHFFNQFIAP